ncbi:hypothetical protein ACVXG7_09075 [Enterobacter hormaechei]
MNLNLQTNRAPALRHSGLHREQTEIGVKYQPVDTTLMTLALYDLTQNNVATYNSAEGWFEMRARCVRKALKRKSTPR